METLTSVERVGRILRRQPVDRVAVGETFWGDTQRAWVENGDIPEGTNLADYFNFDYRQGGWPGLNALPGEPENIIDETDEWKLVRNSNGAHLRYWKDKAGTPEHCHFEVTGRAEWEEMIKPHLLDETLLRKRVNVESYAASLRNARERGIFFFLNGINVFEAIHPVCGHENMLMGMALDPEWVKDMSETFSNLIIRCQEILINEGGLPDGIWFYEDMGFKGKPMMSPTMYKELIWPAHKKTCDFAKSKGLPIVFHSCGFVKALVPGLIEAGMDCLQAMEVKAGMDLVELKKEFGDQIAFCGGLDIRALESNDLEQVEAELLKKVPVAMEGSGYILHTDHSVSSRVKFETYKYFVERGLEIGTY